MKNLIVVKGDKTNNFKPWSIDINTFFLFFNVDKDMYTISHIGENNEEVWNDTWVFHGWDEVSQWVYENIWS